MILERIPEVQQLTAQEQLILAEELWSKFDNEPTPQVDAAVSEVIRERWEHYQRHPETARTWEDMKRSIGRH